MPGSSLRIGLLIRALTVGGAERQLVNLALGLTREGHQVHVLIFYRVGSTLEAEIERAGIPLVDLQKRSRWDLLAFLLRLRSTVRTRELDVVYSFLPTANVLAATVWGGTRGPAVVWGIRSTDASRDSSDWLGRALVIAEQRLTRRAVAIIANSTTAIESCRALGWPPARLHLVPNGLDPEAFRFDPRARDVMRKTWGVSPTERVIGFAGRLDPVKGLEVLLTAIQTLGVEWPALRVVVAGEGSPNYTASLRQQVHELGIEAHIRWLGRTQDMAGFYSAIDLLCLPSLSEGCSNVVAEALACGTPVVATRVGDNPKLVPDPSWLADAGKPVDLARVLRLALAVSDGADREVLRRGILHQLDLSTMIQRTVVILRAAAEPARSSWAS